jgi:putative polyhydroxyalkanoate system protein
MTIQIEHSLSREEAKDRIEQLIGRYQKEYKEELQDLVIDWAGDKAHIRLKARGYSTAGNLDIEDGAVNLDFYVPFMLQIFSKKIRSAIQERIQQSLA